MPLKIMKFSKKFRKVLFLEPRNASKCPTIEDRIPVSDKICQKKLDATKIIESRIVSRAPSIEERILIYKMCHKKTKFY